VKTSKILVATALVSAGLGGQDVVRALSTEWTNASLNYPEFGRRALEELAATNAVICAKQAPWSEITQAIHRKYSHRSRLPLFLII